MSVSSPFINRPIATSLLGLATVLGGALGYFSLPVSSLPQVDFPTIQVSMQLPGANPQTMSTLVTASLERELEQIPALSTMTSTSAYGLSQITMQFNLGFTRSWFQTPNSFDDLNIGSNDPSGNPVGAADQRSQIKTFNIAPSWTRLLSSNAVFTLGAFVRRDQFNYYPSGNPFADFSPIQSLTIAQDRNLTNAGLRSDVNYTKGIHNVKAGVTYQQTFLDENNRFGIVDPAFLDSLADANGNRFSHR